MSTLPRSPPERHHNLPRRASYATSYGDAAADVAARAMHRMLDSTAALDHAMKVTRKYQHAVKAQGAAALEMASALRAVVEPMLDVEGDTAALASALDHTLLSLIRVAEIRDKACLDMENKMLPALYAQYEGDKERNAQMRSKFNKDSVHAHKEIKSSAKQHEKVKRRSLGVSSGGSMQKLELAAQTLDSRTATYATQAMDFAVQHITEERRRLCHLSQVFFDLAQVDVAPRDEVTVLKQQVDQTRALANSPDALPHNTLFEGVQGLRALHGDDDSTTVGAKLESQSSTLSALVRAGVAARDDADSAGYERADRGDDQHDEAEEDDDAAAAIAGQSEADDAHALDAEAAGYASVTPKKGPKSKPRLPAELPPPPPPPPLPERGSNFAEIAKDVAVDESEINDGERVEGESAHGDDALDTSTERRIKKVLSLESEEVQQNDSPVSQMASAFRQGRLNSKGNMTASLHHVEPKGQQGEDTSGEPKPFLV